ncbi:MAG: A24 family peptidase [Pseudomonadota bacterium]|nr:A24 family peptidase [Pseudomonadota bacterium]
MGLFQLLQQSSANLITVSFVLGLLVGSFLNVVIYRLPIMLQRNWRQQCYELLEIQDPQPAEKNSPLTWKNLSLAEPASHCPQCQHHIRAWENIPLVSYVLLGGRCASCKVRIPFRYPAVELATGFLSALVAVNFGGTWLTLALLLFVWALVALTMIDFDHQLLPDNITLPLLWLGLAVNTWDLGTGVTTQESVLGAAGGYLSLWSVYWVFKLATGKDGMGYGDFKLLAALGAWMGWQALFPIVLLSSLAGVTYGIGSTLLMSRDKSAPMPFGPFLAGAGLIMMIWGHQIYSFYITRFLP